MSDEVTFREIEFVRIFDAPRELVWRAWTDPDQVAVWWGPAGMHTPRETVDLDVRPGGVFRVTMVSDENGAAFPSDMRYTKVDEPSVLEFEWDADRGLGAGRVTITLRDLGDGRTEMTNHYAGWATDAIEPFMRQGTDQQYDKLQAYLRLRP